MDIVYVIVPIFFETFYISHRDVHQEVKALQMIHEVHDEDFRQTCARPGVQCRVPLASNSPTGPMHSTCIIFGDEKKYAIKSERKRSDREWLNLQIQKELGK